MSTEPKRRGRPSTFTPDKVAMLCRHLREGKTLKIACELASLNYDTIRVRMVDDGELNSIVSRARHDGRAMRRDDALDELFDDLVTVPRIKALDIFLRHTVENKAEEPEQPRTNVQVILTDPSALRAARELADRLAELRTGGNKPPVLVGDAGERRALEA